MAAEKGVLATSLKEVRAASTEGQDGPRPCRAARAAVRGSRVCALGHWGQGYQALLLHAAGMCCRRTEVSKGAMGCLFMVRCRKQGQVGLDAWVQGSNTGSDAGTAPYLRPPRAVQGCSCQQGGWELDGAGVPQRLCQQRACQADAAVHDVSEGIYCQPRGIQLQQVRHALQKGAGMCTL